MSSVKNTMSESVAGLNQGMHQHSSHATYTSSYAATPTYSQYSQSVPYTTSVVPHASNSVSVRKVSEVVTSEQVVLPPNAREQSRRQVSSVIVYEEEEKIPEKNVRYVEVPQYEEVVKNVVVKEVREVEKVVPKIVEEWVERVVEVPQFEEVIRHVEVPQVQEVVKHVPKVEIVDRPYEVVKHVPKIEIQKVEKVVEVQAETIEVPKAIPVEERVAVTSYQDKDAMLIVSQKVKPVIVDGAKEVVVDVVEYEPEVSQVDIHVAKFVEQELVMMGAKETVHRVVTVPAAQYNSMLRFLNIHLTEEEVHNLPYLQDSNGQVSFLPQDYEWHAPQEGLKIYGYRAGQVYGHGTPVVPRKSASSMTDAEIRARQNELDRQFQQIFQQFEAERARRSSAIDEFNRQQEMKVRQIIGSHHAAAAAITSSHPSLMQQSSHSFITSHSHRGPMNYQSSSHTVGLSGAPVSAQK